MNLKEIYISANLNLFNYHNTFFNIFYKYFTYLWEKKINKIKKKKIKQLL